MVNTPHHERLNLDDAVFAASSAITGHPSLKGRVREVRQWEVGTHPQRMDGASSIVNLNDVKDIAGISVDMGPDDLEPKVSFQVDVPGLATRNMNVPISQLGDDLYQSYVRLLTKQ